MTGKGVRPARCRIPYDNLARRQPVIDFVEYIEIPSGKLFGLVE